MSTKVTKKIRTKQSVEHYNLVQSLKGKVTREVIATAINSSLSTVSRMLASPTYEDYQLMLKKNNAPKSTVVLKQTLPQGVVKSKELDQLGNMTSLALLQSCLRELKEINVLLSKKKFIF